jgi:hypothetical protein
MTEKKKEAKAVSKLKRITEMYVDLLDHDCWTPLITDLVVAIQAQERWIEAHADQIRAGELSEQQANERAMIFLELCSQLARFTVAAENPDLRDLMPSIDARYQKLPTA